MGLPGSSLNDVPYVSLMALHARAKAMNTAETKAWTANADAWAREMAAAYEDSVRYLETYYVSRERRAVAMYGNTRVQGAEPSVPSGRTSEARRIARAVSRAGGIEISDDASHSSSYLGFEVSPLRTLNGARWTAVPGTALVDGVAAAGAGNPVFIDLLGFAPGGSGGGARGGAPARLVVQEIKVNRPKSDEQARSADSDPPEALVQALLYAATLHPAEQRERLRMSFPGNDVLEAPYRVDAQVVLAGDVRSEDSERRELWRRTPGLIEALNQREGLAYRLPSVSGIRVPLEVAEPEFDGPVLGTLADWRA